MNTPSLFSCQQGFSLIEMLIVVAILGILVLIGYPAIISLLQSMESQRIENELKQALRQARSESFITKQDVVVCMADSNRQCNRTAQDSLLVFIDSNRNGRIDNKETPIYQTSTQLKYGTLTLNASLHRPYMRYQGNTGKPTGHFGHIKYCSQSDNKHLSFKLIVNAHGNVRIERHSLTNIAC